MDGLREPLVQEELELFECLLLGLVASGSLKPGEQPSTAVDRGYRRQQDPLK